jgi:SAM-dependent methyltransferase
LSLAPATEARLTELRPYIERARQMEGWNFAYTPRPVGPPPPWDYVARARELVQHAALVLDLGTGGGEVLAEILAGAECRAVAAEAWPPNVPVAARQLGSLSVSVVHSSSLSLPFAGPSFDLVLDRHEELSPAEVARVLRPGGRVLTQQIHPDWHGELREFFPRMTVFEQHQHSYPEGFAAAGLDVVDFREHSQAVAYRSLGEIAYMLEAAPWTVPEFDLEADLAALLALERVLRRPEGILLTDRRYILEARKPLKEQP